MIFHKTVRPIRSIRFHVDQVIGGGCWRSKENGVHIEGIAVKGGVLYLGFRDPVFRDTYVPVMTRKFDDPADTHDLLFVRLGGRGLRSLACVSDGFLNIAGPVGDGPGSYQLYHWDTAPANDETDLAAP